MNKSYRYTNPHYTSITYTVGSGDGKVTLTEFLNDLHSVQLDCIDEAVDKSDLSDAKAVIQWIKEKL